MIITILFGVVGFGIMVFVHELGHFVAAKRVGIEVEAFSLGWGKKLIGFDYKGTNYRLSIIPFGGFCKMKGELPTEKDAKPAVGSFFAATPWRRIVTAAAGPLANVSFAILVLTFIWWVGFNIYSDDNRIVLASDYSLDSMDVSPATAAGLKTGDRIIDINGQNIEKFQDILETISTAPNETLNLIILRGQERLQLSIVPELDMQTGAGRIGIYAWRELVIDDIQQGSSADIAGLRRGDRITAIAGQEVLHSIDLYQSLKGSPGVLRLSLLRDGQILERDLVLSYTDEGVAELGIGFQVNVFRSQVPLHRAIIEGLNETGRTMVLTVKGIRLLFKGVNVRNAVAGPLRITYYVGSVARSGFRLGFGEGMVSYFRFLCLLSIILFIMNLLPIPALDGGQILIFVIETVRRKSVNPLVIARIQTIGFSVLILLAVFITFSDVLFFMGK